MFYLTCFAFRFIKLRDFPKQRNSICQRMKRRKEGSQRRLEYFYGTYEDMGWAGEMEHEFFSFCEVIHIEDY